MSQRPSLDAEDYAEIVRRLVSLREAVADLAAAYDDPGASQGADEMRGSLDRVLQLLAHGK